MSISPVPFGLLAMYAEDMYTPGSLQPQPEPRIDNDGWTVVGHLVANDVLIPTGAHQRLSINRSQRVFYGFLARNKTDPNSFVVAVRGTDGLVEWLIDAEFLLVRHPNYPATQVEQGFWGIYQTMSLLDIATGTTYAIAADGIAAMVGAGSVTVTGHSLGSAIATYLTFDVAVKLGSRATACLFASPRTGDAAWAALFDTKVATYQLYNYILDVVTHVPTLGYTTLSKVTLLNPKTAQAKVRLDVFCNHHVICYCAMIDYAAAMAAPADPDDVKCKLCVSPPPMSQAATGLADVIDDFGIGDEKALAMLNALHTISLAAS
jgi:triacylglycerol lipase